MAAPSVAILSTSLFDFRNTCRRWTGDTELYRCMIARGAPLIASYVLLMICSLACVST